MLIGCKQYVNHAENEFYRAAIQAGYDVTKRGWPDFILVKDGRLVLVEVKPDLKRNPQMSKRLKKEQKAVMSLLAMYGVPCFKWSPTSGFVRISAC